MTRPRSVRITSYAVAACAWIVSACSAGDGVMEPDAGGPPHHESGVRDGSSTDVFDGPWSKDVSAAERDGTTDVSPAPLTADTSSVDGSPDEAHPAQDPISDDADGRDGPAAKAVAERTDADTPLHDAPSEFIGEVRAEGAVAPTDGLTVDGEHGKVDAGSRGDALHDASPDHSSLVAVDANDEDDAHRRHDDASDGFARGDAAELFDVSDTAPKSDAHHQSTSTLVRSRGAMCLECAEDPFNSCVLPGFDCESFDDLGSPSSQQARCYETLGCMMASGCPSPPSEQPDPGNALGCYCGALPYPTCISTPGNGQCRAIEERNLGSTLPSVVVSTFTDTATGAGMANGIAACLATFCQRACFR